MTDMTYFRIGVPNDMVADIMWHDDFEVSMEPRKPKPETNYERYFGTPGKAARTASQMCRAVDDCDHCPFKNEHGCPEWISASARKWLESEAE